MKELKTKKSAEGASVKEKSDALPRAAKRMLRAGLMERQASRRRSVRQRNRWSVRRCGAGRRLRTQAGRYSGRLCLCGQNGKRTNGRMHRQ